MRRATLAAAVSAFGFLFATPTFAQTQPGGSYAEQKVDSGQAVIFRDDPLRAGGLDPNGYIIQVRGAFWRTALLRPRLNFVPEMLKSAESL
jgi:hypothetical protein